LRKTFKHNLLPVIDVTEEYIDGKRYYVMPNGRKYPSVTTVISKKLPKKGIEEWRKKIGEEKADRILKQSNIRGTAVHAMAEKYVLNEENYTKGHNIFNISTFNDLKTILNDRVDNILGIEMPLYSNALNTAGRGDLFAEYDGVVSYIDYKTSRNEKKNEEWIENYFIQATTYSLMFEHLYKIKVPQIVIMIAVDNCPPQIFVKDRGNYVNRVLEIFTT
jgi:ATP-dependent exoDNAse (exonuclease V) beta subunit